MVLPMLLVVVAAVDIVSTSLDGPALEYHIMEELPAHTLIGNVGKDAKLTDKYDQSVFDRLTYSFLGLGDAKQKYFTLEEQTGFIRTTSQIDRDKICPYELTCYVWLDVAIQPPQYFQVIKIKVDIHDVNDHRPEFPQKAIALTIPESAMPGSLYALPTATDTDSAGYGIQRYDLASDTKRFELKTTINSIDGSTDVRLMLKRSLDREQEVFYQLRVIARDGGTPPKSGVLLVNVTVEDMNDNDPVFENSTYQVFVLENIAAGSTITRVRATDADSGPNGDITYGFAGRTQANYGNIFGIDNTTGIIYLKKPLDFESQATYLMTVLGRDKGPGARVGRAAVVVRVRDDNDNVPVITVNALTPTGVAQASESAPPGTFVAHVSVTDKDSGDNGRVSCAVTRSLGKFDLEQLYKSQYKLITSSPLNRETAELYHVMITCHDHGDHQNSATQNVTVRILDENDHTPVFAQNLYKAELFENNYIGAHIVKVNATDLDIGANGRIRFKVEPEWQGSIEVGPSSGQVSAAAIFDREKIDQIRFQLIAYDLGEPSLSSTATVIVDIIDVNDEKPKFSRYEYSFAVFENEPPGTEVDSVSAIDKDEGVNAEFEYTIVDADTDATRWFSIDPQSGKIVTRVMFDREKLSTYSFTLRASNMGYPPMSSTASVTVYIADRNDNSPLIEFPNTLNDTAYVSNMVPVGYTVAQIIAHDADNGANQKLIYYIISGNRDNIFQLNSQTGEVSVGTSMMSITYETYTLVVLVKDNGYPPQRTQTDLKIVVNHSIAYNHYKEAPVVSREKLTIIVALTLAALILLLVVCLAICIIIRKSRRAQKNSGKYSCRNETERMLSIIDEREREKERQVVDGPDSIRLPLKEDEKTSKKSKKQKRCKHNEAPQNNRDSRFIISVSPSKEYSRDRAPSHLTRPDFNRVSLMFC